jgi:hypothetical protein
MSKSNTFENDFLLLVFNNTNIALIGDATGIRGATTVGNLFMSLHTADPGEAGDQTTSEIAYTSYARVSLARTSGVFSVAGNAVSLVGNVTFPAGTGGTGTATHWGIGASTSGVGKLLYKGAISPTIACGNGITPQLTAGTMVTED